MNINLAAIKRQIIIMKFNSIPATILLDDDMLAVDKLITDLHITLYIYLDNINSDDTFNNN